MSKTFRPFAVIGRCWVPEEVALAPNLTVEPLGIGLGFGSELDFVIALADQLELKVSDKFRGEASRRLEETEPTVLARFAEINASDFDEAVEQLGPQLELACDALAFMTTNVSLPIAVLLVENEDTFRVRFFPPTQARAIHLGERGEKMPQIVAAAETTGEIELAFSLLRVGVQARTREFRIFHYIQAVEVLTGLAPGGGSLDAKIRRLLKQVAIKPMPTPTDRSRDFAHVLAELRNVVGHGRRLERSAVQPWAADYIDDPELERQVFDLARDVIEALAVQP